ncbi:MAG: hypothetical protein ABS75_03140 [Pelagibacterium sp. SCN 63-23]|nr:MAG: hypothetical protein ABS75_03140 [Pelagibacterium sp. SCN 63-23]
MSIRRLTSSLALLLLATSSVQAAPALWRVSDADSAIWVFGSVHMLQPDTDWRSPLLNKILAKADRIFFETDVGPAAQARIIPLTFELGFNRDGRLLSDKIGPELTARVRDAAEEYSIPMASLLTMQPWLAATTLSIGPLMDSGFEATSGVETVLVEEIPLERQGFLETAEEQLGFLASGSEAEQISMLEATLDTLHMMQDDIESMVDAWLAGEPETLGEMFMSQMGDYDQGMVERIIDQRNHNWVTQIETMLADNEQVLLVVGAAHMTGDASVIRLLEDKGFASERLQ